MSQELTDRLLSATQFPEDKFIKYFIGKCQQSNHWDKLKLLEEDGEIKAAIVVTHTKRRPYTANIQLLHTFYKHRGKGYATQLCLEAVRDAFHAGMQYFRVSANPKALEFYKKVGFRLVGRQKSGCQLAIFKLVSPILAENPYIVDDVIRKALYKKGMGGCVEVFEDDTTN